MRYLGTIRNVTGENEPQAVPGVLSDRFTGLLSRSPLRTTAGLARATGIDRASISQKLHGRRRWYLDEVIAIALALDTTVAYLIGESESSATARSLFTTDEDPDTLGLFVAVEGSELARRLRFLHDTSLVTAENRMPESHPLSGDEAIWSKLLSLSERTRVSRQLLDAIAKFFNVPAPYLIELDNPDFAERVEAEIEFDRAVAESGVQRVAARSLGSLSAAEIRALTAALTK